MGENSETYTTVSAEYLRKLGTAVLEKAGVPVDDAEVTINSLVETDLRGVHSHGMIRLPGYVGRLKKGGINPNPNVQAATESEGTAVIDGDNGFGQVVSNLAMGIAIEKSKAVGVGIAGVHNSGHFGACAHWAQMALPHDMIGIATTNGGPIMAPWGGVTPTMGNDPLGVAIPAGEELPIVLDMATSVVAGGLDGLGGQLQFAPARVPGELRLADAHDGGLVPDAVAVGRDDGLRHWLLFLLPVHDFPFLQVMDLVVGISQLPENGAGVLALQRSGAGAA